MRIAIVDDDARDREQILSCLSQYFSKAEKACETTVFEDAVSFLSDYHYEFDFIILDIDMPEISGIDAAKSLREKDPNGVFESNTSKKPFLSRSKWPNSGHFTAARSHPWLKRPKSEPLHFGKNVPGFL